MLKKPQKARSQNEREKYPAKIKEKNHGIIFFKFSQHILGEPREAIRDRFIRHPTDPGISYHERLVFQYGR